MSIASEITRLQGVKADILQSISDKGVTVPAVSALDDCPGLIGQISGSSNLPIGTLSTGASNSIDFINKIISCKAPPLKIVGPFAAPTEKQSFEIDLSLDSFYTDYGLGVFSGGSNTSSLMLQINYANAGTSFIGIPNESATGWYDWNNGSSIIDLRSYINSVNTFYHIKLEYDLLTHKFVMEIDNEVIFNITIPITPLFTSQTHFNLFTNSGETNNLNGKFRADTIRVINDTRIF